MEELLNLEEDYPETGLYETLIEETPSKYVYGVFNSEKEYKLSLKNGEPLTPLYTREIEKEGNPQVLWALILNPEKGLPVYNYLLNNNKINIITILSSTLLGTFSNNYLQYSDKKSALIASLQLLKYELVNDNVYNDYKDIIQNILEESGFLINLEEI